MDFPYLSWVEISRSAYGKNLSFFKKLIDDDIELTVVVKANAYGHGLPQIVQLALENNVRSFAVHSLEEALKVKNIAAESEILIMGPIYPGDLEQVVANDFRIAIFDPQTLAILNQITKKLQKRVRLHLKINTGTNRLGIRMDEVDQYIHEISSNSLFHLEGVYTHFANIEDTTNHEFAFRQLRNFKSFLNKISNKASVLKVHTACSAAILLFKDTHFNMVRLGISQYGMWPSRETFVSYKLQHTQNGEDVLTPVLSWRARIGQILRVPSGECIGYGCTFKVTRDTIIATLPVGYSDGVDRRLSNNGYFLVKGVRAPIRGRICMNLTMIDVTDIPGVQIGDTVTLIGKDGQEQITATDWAAWIHTINYEITSRINPSIPRIITE